MADLFLEKRHDRIEMFDMPHLDQASARPGRRHDFFRLLQGGAKGLLDQKVTALCEEGHGNFRVPVGRNDDRNRLASRAEFLDRPEGPAAMAGADFRGAGGVAVKYACKLGPGQPGIDAGMVLAQGADAGHAAADF